MSNQIQQLDQSEEYNLIRQTLTVAQLFTACEAEISRFNRLQLYNEFISRNPHRSWIKEDLRIKYDDGSVHRHIPIGKLEAIMTYVFGEWYPEIIESSQLANGASVTCRIHYFDRFVDNRWKFIDGVGGAGLQRTKPKNEADMIDYKLIATEIGLPKAYTNARKNAIGNIGPLFGSNLNRRDVIDFFAPKKEATKSQSNLNL